MTSLKIEPNVEVCRHLTVNDENVYRKVHGGVILQLIEEAGYIACVKHCNRNSSASSALTPLLCRIERTDFIAPMNIAELAIAKATLVYSTERTLCVQVDIYNDKLINGHSELKCT